MKKLIVLFCLSIVAAYTAWSLPATKGIGDKTVKESHAHQMVINITEL